MKSIFLYFLFILGLFISPIPGQTLLGPPNMLAYGSFGRSIAHQGDKLLVGSYYPAAGLAEDNVFAFKKVGMDWVFDGKLVPEGVSLTDHYGTSLSVYGDYAVVGDIRSVNGQQPGRAYVFHRTGDEQWQFEAVLESSDNNAFDWFGTDIAMYGNTLLVGASRKQNGKGAVYVFTLQNGIWEETAILNSGINGNTGFGQSISFYGDYAVVGTNLANKAFIFKKNGLSWGLQQTIDPPAGGDIGFAYDVALYKDRMIASGGMDDEIADDAGAAFIYKRNGDIWELEQKLTASDGGANKIFGYPVSLSEFYANIGAPWEIKNGNMITGAAYVFKREGTVWAEQAKYMEPDVYGFAAEALAMFDNIAMVGAPNSNEFAEQGGAVYLYTFPEIASAANDPAYSVETSVFPNPANDRITVYYPAHQIPNYYEVIGSDGKLLQRSRLVQADIPVQHLPPGEYFLRVVFDAGMGAAKFVKG